MNTSEIENRGGGGHQIENLAFRKDWQNWPAFSYTDQENKTQVIKTRNQRKDTTYYWLHRSKIIIKKYDE